MTPPNHIPQLQDAKERIQILASGRDPDTGKLLAISNATITALQLAIHSIDLTNTTLSYAAHKLSKMKVFLSLLQQPSPHPTTPPDAPEPQRALKHGQPWTPQQDKQLLADFHTGTPLPELATRHDRTPTAISMRLVHLGSLPPATGLSPNTSTKATSTNHG